MAKRGRPRHPDILTPREWEVLALLREGLTNDQIAERLEITERTAKFHVSEILSKLGVSTRQEAASWVPAERGPWSVLGAPLAAVRRLAPAWTSAALVGGVVIAVGAGVGVLVWGLVRTTDDGGAAASSAGQESSEPASNEAFANGVPTTLLYAAGGLRPIDPATGDDLAGYDAIITERGPIAVSPDGSTAALVMWPTGDDVARLKLFDLARWEWTDVASWQPGDVEVTGDARELRWSADASRLFIRAEEDCAVSAQGIEPACASRLIAVDATSREAIARVALPRDLPLAGLGGPTGREITATFVPAADGSLVYVLGGSSVNPSKARLVAIDPAAGAVIQELELPDVLLGPRPEPDDLRRVTDYVPAFVSAPDGRRAYIVHADAERVTVVDLQAMRVERSSEIGRRISLFEKALSMLANKARADGRAPFSEKWATISPDGRHLYVGGGHALREPGDPRGVGAYADASAGLQVIETESLEIVKEIESGGECEYRDLAAHPSGRYLYAFAGGTDPALTGIPLCGEGGLLVLDAQTLETVARRGFVNSVAVAPAATSGQAGG